jgi:hypothetical protein
MTRPSQRNDIIVKIVATTLARDNRTRTGQGYGSKPCGKETANNASASIIGGETELERRARRFEIWNRLYFKIDKSFDVAVDRLRVVEFLRIIEYQY